MKPIDEVIMKFCFALKNILIVFTLLAGHFVNAESLTILTPSDVTIFNGRPEMFDEVVLSFKNIPAGDYQFRFINIDKPEFESLEVCEDGSGISLDYYREFISLRTSGKIVLSAKGSETAEIRLIQKPYKTSGQEVDTGIQTLQGPVCSESPITKSEWLAAEMLNTNWLPLVTVRTARNLIIRIEKETYGYGSFELAVVKK